MPQKVRFSLIFVFNNMNEDYSWFAAWIDLGLFMVGLGALKRLLSGLVKEDK